MKTGIVFDQVVGAVLTYYRKLAGLSQHQAIEGTSIGSSSLSRLEKGDYSLSMDQLFELSKRFEIEMSDITSSIVQTCNNIEIKGIHISLEKKRNTDILMLSTESVFTLLIDEKGKGIGSFLEKKV